MLLLLSQKEYARYKQGKGWKHLVVYKSGIHALGLYTSRFISRGEMVRYSQVYDMEITVNIIEYVVLFF